MGGRKLLPQTLKLSPKVFFSGERKPRAAHNQRLARYARVPRANTTETPCARGREQRHMIKYTLLRQRGQAKWLTSALVASMRIL